MMYICIHIFHFVLLIFQMNLFLHLYDCGNNGNSLIEKTLSPNLH